MRRHIRILQVISAFNNDAPSQGAAALGKYLDPSEFHVTAVSLRAMNGPPSTTVAELARARIEHVSMGMRGFHDLRVLPRLVRFMRQERPDIVHTHSFRADLWAGLASKIAGTSIFVTSVRNQEWDCFRTELSAHIARLAMAGSRIATSMADVLIAVSEGVRDHFVMVQGIPPAKVRVILNGVDLERLYRPESRPPTVRKELDIKPDDILVGTLASFKPRKGLSYLVHAAGEVLSRQRRVHFILAGDGPERGRIEEEVQQRGLAKHVHLLGYRHDAVTLLNALDLYVLPSLFEGLPRSVLEAMALAKPVVVTNIGGSREVVEDSISGLIVPPRDPQSLAEAISTLVESPTLRKSMGEAGRCAVEERFNARVNARAHRELYRELLAAKQNL
ncbi:MAG: glycosyltransferase [Anaerolineae bacterium]